MDQQGQNGLDTTFREAWRNRGGTALVIAGALIGFYMALYFGDLWWDAHPIDRLANNLGLRNRWFVYGLLYSIAMFAGGAYYLRRHGNSRYNRYRIIVNVSVQVVCAFTLPLVMPFFLAEGPGEYWKYEFQFSYLWPLDWYKLHPQTLANAVPVFAVYSIVGSLIAVPILAYFFGKRWYCSWVCGCGGLANTFGDPWRHLTSPSTKAWRFEKASIYTIMFLAILSTGMLFVDHFHGEGLPLLRKWVAKGPDLPGGYDKFESYLSVKGLYGAVVGSILAGVAGTGLYPLFGPRLWCRNFCPMAAVLGLFQKLGRFRITVKPDMCISCGNCTTYCEMGIDVRSYAQSNESFTRSSCVGCGMCAHMCPRGVLRLENVSNLASEKKRSGLRIVNL